MKLFALPAVVSCCLVLAGCAASGTVGGPGDTASRNPLWLAPNTFTIGAPMFGVSLRQGQSKPVEIEIHRGKDFDQSVSLRVDPLPEGVTVEPSEPVIEASEKTALLTLIADNEAPLGEFTVRLTAQPQEGANAVDEFKLSIEAP
jgi:hypothetical protein